MSGAVRSPSKHHVPKASTRLRRLPLLTLTAPRSTQRAAPRPSGSFGAPPMAFRRLRGLTDSPAEERLLIPQPLPRAWPRLQRPTRGRPALASEDKRARRLPWGFGPFRVPRCVESAFSLRCPGVPARSAIPPQRFSRSRGFHPQRPRSLVSCCSRASVSPFEAFILRTNVPTLVVW